MGELFFLVIVGVIVAGVVMGRAQSKRASDAWSAVARELALAYDQGGMMKSRALTGRHRKNYVQVDTFRRGSGKHSSTFTRYRIRYPLSLGLGLRITKEGMFSGVSKALGGQDIEVGDDGFDPGALVKGNDERAVRQFLTSTRRAWIRHALETFSRLKIEDEQIYWEQSGMQRSAERLSETIQRLSLLACVLWEHEEADQTSAPPPLSPPDSRPKEVVRPVPTTRKKAVRAAIPAAGNRDAASRPPALPKDAAVPIPASQPQTGAKAEPESLVAESAELSAASVCAALFQDGSGSAVIERRFAASYVGRQVSWRGTLQSHSSTSFDFAFGNQPCTKATFDLVEIDDKWGGRKTVKAVVQFPPESEELLRGKAGTELEFSGELLKVDGLMRSLFVKTAVLD